MLCPPEHDYILARIMSVLLWNWCLADRECHLLIHQPALLVAPTDQWGQTLSLNQAELGKQTARCAGSQRTLNVAEERDWWLELRSLIQGGLYTSARAG